MILSVLNSCLGKDAIAAALRRGKKVFFVGIGGIGMQGLAFLLKERGFSVAGSEREESAAVSRLRAAGISVTVGHKSENSAGSDLLVYTLAVSPDNPELTYARANAIPCVSRAELLGYLMHLWDLGIAVAGTHGKSSVTGMLAAALSAAGCDPTVIAGAPLSADGASFRAGGERFFLCEACEYKDSFLHLTPQIAVALNLELEHTDYFHSRAQIENSFLRFLASAKIAVLPSDAKVAPPTPDGVRAVRFGLEEEADARAENIVYTDGCAAFDLCFCGKKCGQVSLRVPGEHNLTNALAALAVCAVLGVDMPAACAGISSFTGVGRRLERRGRFCGMTVYDDYAHHPTEIRASLAALRRAHPHSGLLCVFQPHTYSRTAALFSEFAESLGQADRVYLLDIYAAREQNESGVDIRCLAAAIPHAVYCPLRESLPARLADEGKKGDILVFMGAGDIAALPNALPYDA